MAATIPPHAGQPVTSVGPALGDGRVVVIAAHGRGASPASILEVAPMIGNPQVTFLAPAAAGNAWYPNWFMAPLADNEPGLSSAIGVLYRLIDDAVAHGVPIERIVLMGFSQGAALVSTALVQRPARYGGLLVYSGALCGPPGTAWNAAGDFAETPAFFGCSDTDQYIPEPRVQESAAHFARMNAAVTTRIYPGMAHTINDDELQFGKALLSELVTG